MLPARDMKSDRLERPPVEKGTKLVGAHGRILMPTLRARKRLVLDRPPVPGFNAVYLSMRSLFAILCLQALPAQDAPPPDKKAEEAYLKRVKRIQQAIDWLVDGDADLRAAGRKILREIGPEAIPFLERRLADRGMGEVYATLRELRTREGNFWVEEKDLPTAEQMDKDVPKLARDQVDKYVFVKYHEAWSLAKKGRYEKAVEIVQAVLVLEPRTAHSEGLRRLRRFCDIRITQTTMCEAQAIPAKTIAIAGEKVEVKLRLRNVSKQPILIAFPADGQGFAVVDYSIRVPMPKGDVHEASKSQEIRIEKEISIAVGAEWESSFPMDTGTALEEAQELRIVQVQAWMQPSRIDLGTIPTNRRIVFEPAVVKIVSRKYEKDLTNPLAALGRYMDGGTVNDVFVMALLLEKEDREKGIELLIGAMRHAESRVGQTFLATLLTFLTEQKLGPDPRAWRAWWEDHKKGQR